MVRYEDNKSLKHGHSFLNILHSLLRDVKSSVLSIKHSCGPGGSLFLRKLMFDCVIEVQHLDIEFSSLESLDDITVPCTELVAVVLLGLRSRLS